MSTFLSPTNQMYGAAFMHRSWSRMFSHDSCLDSKLVRVATILIDFTSFDANASQPPSTSDTLGSNKL